MTCNDCGKEFYPVNRCTCNWLRKLWSLLWASPWIKMAENKDHSRAIEHINE